MSSASTRERAAVSRVPKFNRWLLLVAALGVAAAFYFWRARPDRAPVAASPEAASRGEPTGPPSSTDGSLLRLTSQEAQSAGVRVVPVEEASFTESLWVTGKVALNDDRLAHIFPLVDGRVKSVNVRYGDEVKAGELLAIVQSEEVGNVKLELIKDRLARQFAETKHAWNQRINENVQELIAELENGLAIEEIEPRFRDRPMGDYRERLLSAYANLYRSEADYARLESLAGTGIAPGKQLIAAKADRDANKATLQAWLEQVKYTARQAALESEHALREAETRVLTDERHLEILGYSTETITEENLDKEGDRLSDYPITAPFDGTVLSKDVVLLERVSPDRQLFQVADLSTVWVTADIYEQHLPRLAGLEGRKLRVRSKVWPDRQFTAEVFFTGELVDEQSRTVAMTARAENPDRLLKPGMFVEVELSGDTRETVLQVPTSAIQEHAGQAFVFVETADNEFAPRDVRVGRTEESRVEVLEGLKAGERVAARGGFALKTRMLADQLGGN